MNKKSAWTVKTFISPIEIFFTEMAIFKVVMAIKLRLGKT